jgi:hypothetical protein
MKDGHEEHHHDHNHYHRSRRSEMGLVARQKPKRTWGWAGYSN